MNWWCQYEWEQNLFFHILVNKLVYCSQYIINIYKVEVLYVVYTGMWRGQIMMILSVLE